MYVTLYQWRVKADKEEQFIAAWTALTQQIQNKIRGLSGRLHRTPDGAFVAIVNWPSPQAWESQNTETIDISKQQDLLSCIENIETVLPMEVITEIQPSP